MPFRTERERKVDLTELERDKILRLDPSFQEITQAAYFDNYDLPCPVRVEVRTRENQSRIVVLRTCRHGNVDIEIKMFRALGEYGLPVPKILAEPFRNEHGRVVAIYSLLEGENLQRLSMQSFQALQDAKHLLLEAVHVLMDAGNFILEHEVSESLPRRDLRTELETIEARQNGWREAPLFQLAVEKLNAVLPGVSTPLVLSNGDYQPGNFLAKDGRITGYLDFESPRYQDPLLGFVKFPIYDLRPLSRTDLVETFLIMRKFTKRDFTIRLALGCLKTLQNEMVPINRAQSDYGKRVVGLLNSALDELG